MSETEGHWLLDPVGLLSGTLRLPLMEAQGLTVSSADGVRRMDFHRQGRLQFPERISLRRGFQKGSLDL